MHLSCPYFHRDRLVRIEWQRYMKNIFHHSRHRMLEAAVMSPVETIRMGFISQIYIFFIEEKLCCLERIELHIII